MKLIVTTRAQATVEEQWVIDVPDESDYMTDEGFGTIADGFFDALADGDSAVKIESHDPVGEPDVAERSILAIEGPEDGD